MPQNLEFQPQQSVTPQMFINNAIQALYDNANHPHNQTNCVGVMIQAGKTLTSPINWMKTAFGGHVSPFIINNGILSSWDEMVDRWQETTNNNAMLPAYNNNLMNPSNANDVTCYIHTANQQEIDAVVQRAQHLADPNHPHFYSHWPRFGNNHNYGDCVSLTSWVMQAFSYSSGVSGATTPWMESLKYEAYANPLNFLSQWCKVKYIGQKLAVM